jgi:hypothetical protein
LTLPIGRRICDQVCRRIFSGWLEAVLSAVILEGGQAAYHCCPWKQNHLYHLRQVADVHDIPYDMISYMILKYLHDVKYDIMSHDILHALIVDIIYDIIYGSGGVN